MVLHTFPIANNPLSKSNSTPKNTNATPKPARPTPISVDKETIRMSMHSFTKYEIALRVYVSTMYTSKLSSKQFNMCKGTQFKGTHFYLLTLCIANLKHVFCFLFPILLFMYKKSVQTKSNWSVFTLSFNLLLLNANQILPMPSFSYISIQIY